MVIDVVYIGSKLGIFHLWEVGCLCNCVRDRGCTLLCVGGSGIYASVCGRYGLDVALLCILGVNL